ncbi:MAG: hypothetical protein J6W81_04805 [Lentisphaeria bacterium]|nr:hypothetical protein [Lentisphaeria bacterium]
MKKIFLITVAAAVIAMFGTACTVVTTNDAAQESGYVIRPAVYDPIVKHENRKISGSATWHSLFGFINWGLGQYAERTELRDIFPNVISLVKQSAVFDACDTNKCDIILGTKYVITVDDYLVYKTVNCTVTGFPGQVVGLERRQIQDPMDCCHRHPAKK